MTRCEIARRCLFFTRLLPRNAKYLCLLCCGTFRASGNTLAMSSALVLPHLARIDLADQILLPISHPSRSMCELFTAALASRIDPT